MAQRPTVTQMSRKFESHAFTIWLGTPLQAKVGKKLQDKNIVCHGLHRYMPWDFTFRFVKLYNKYILPIINFLSLQIAS